MCCKVLEEQNACAVHVLCKILEGLSHRPPPCMPPPPSRQSAYPLRRAFAAAKPFSIIKGASVLTWITPFPMCFCTSPVPGSRFRSLDHARITGGSRPGSRSQDGRIFLPTRPSQPHASHHLGQILTCSSDVLGSDCTYSPLPSLSLLGGWMELSFSLASFRTEAMYHSLLWFFSFARELGYIWICVHLRPPPPLSFPLLGTGGCSHV